ncbi:MAG TPA: Hsp20/alpha crystallin family protein [Candidatus Sulfotelmatobacter sp.]|nr:Hsp20/alpha crystallin family protein [Candidatus Sulfotelmatobacter sp.]
MDYDYSNRSFLLPEGCKDLIDVIQPTAAVTEHGFVLTVQLAGVQSDEIEITVVGRTLRIGVRQGASHAPFGGTVVVPWDYAIAQAQATYFKDKLYIVVPKASGAGAPPCHDLIG